MCFTIKNIFYRIFDINIIDPFRFIFRFKSVIGNANALCIVDIICPASVASTFFRICDHYSKSVFFL